MRSNRQIAIRAMVLLGAAAPCMATSPMPGSIECAVLSRVATAGKGGAPAGPLALEVLERVAEGRMESASNDLEAKVGLQAGQLRTAAYKSEIVRSCSLREIGQMGTPEALEFLRNLKKADILGPDPSGHIWSSAQIALHEAELNQLADEPAKVHFLEDTTVEKSGAAWWAVQELCNRGSIKSLPYIRQYLATRVIIPQDVERNLRSCEERMDIVSLDPDRVKALGSFLTVRNGVTDLEILGWAINELRAIGSLRANAELERYADEIEALPDGSPSKATLWWKRVQIRGMVPPTRK